MNTGSGICKSYKLLSSELRTELREGLASLLVLPEKERDWHPESHQQELDLVTPSLFPLVYGKTRVLTDGGEVGLDGFLNSYGHGKLAPEYGEDYLDGDAVGARESSRTPTPFWTYNQYLLDRFSKRFQWLPYEVEFTG